MNLLKDVYGVGYILKKQGSMTGVKDSGGSEYVSVSGHKDINLLLKETEQCLRCILCKTRSNVVFGEGNDAADLMFVGEGPGAEEDRQGRPFVGRAGQLLTKMINAMNLERKDVYIANIVKCRPPENRNPFKEEIAKCIGYLYSQIDIVNPKVIVCLGSVAAQALLQTDKPISRLRGTFVDLNGINVMPTFHPAYLLRNPKMKRPAWEDLQAVMKILNL